MVAGKAGGADEACTGGGEDGVEAGGALDVRQNM